MSRDFEEHFMSKARLNALMSTCQTRHVGAVAVRGRRQILDGFNGNLPGELHCDEGGCVRCAAEGVVSGSGLDKCLCVHAEENIITYAAMTGVALGGCTVYTTTKPCLACYKLLAGAGVHEVVFEFDYPSELPELRRMALRRFVRVG